MCRFCDYDSEDCKIFQDGISGDWYLDVQTYEWDDYDDGWVHQKEYISYCPYCGEELKNYEKEQ